MQSLMTYIYIYIYAIYIYIYMKDNKGVVEIKFYYPMFACEESNKACEETGKGPWENLTTSFLEKDFLEKDFLALFKIVY